MTKKDWGKIKEQAEQKEAELAQEESLEEAKPEGEVAEPENEVLHELQTRLHDAEAKADQNWQQVLAAKAELDNARKRCERDVEKARKFGAEKLVGELLPVIDSMQRGLEGIDKENEAFISMVEGMQLTMDMLVKVLEKHGVTQLNPIGETFNPDQHEAMSMQEDPSAPANTVLQVLQPGYILNERLVRAAMVIVSK